MADAVYWTRALARLWVLGDSLKLTYTSRDGSQKTCIGRLHALGSDGPYIMWEGKPARLCPWAKLISVEDCRKEVAGR